MIGIKENDFLAVKYRPRPALPAGPLFCAVMAQCRAEETDDEDRSMSCRVDDSVLVDERASKHAGSRRADRKVRGVLQQLVRDARPGAGVLQRPVHRHALRLTRSFSCHCQR